MQIKSLKDLKEEPTTHNPKVKKKVLIKDRQFPNLVYFSQVTVKSGQILSEHKHEDMIEVFLVRNGEGIVKINGKVEKVQADNYLVVEPGEPHEFLNTSTEDLLLIYFGLKS